MTVSVGNVGATAGDPENHTFLDALALWLLKNDRDLADRWMDEGVKHDYIDLNQGRDFLKESKRYDVVVLHNLYEPGRGEPHLHTGYYAVSPQHTVANWRRRLAQTGADLIAIYGIDLSGDYIGDLPGYSKHKAGRSSQTYYIKDKLPKQAGYAEERDRILEWVNGFGDPIRLYREVYAAPKDVITSNMGVYWTPEKSKAHSPYGKLDNPTGTKVVLVIDAPRSAVDEAGTVNAMRRYPGEREIRLLSGSQVKLVGIIEDGKMTTRLQSAKIASQVAARYLEAIARMTFYHGTDFDNLKSIAKKGLVAHNGLQWGGASALDPGTGAVFLTSDFNLAARYGLGAARTQTPVVLDVSITAPKRFKRLRYDPMDQMDNAWDVEESYDDEGKQVQSDLDELERSLIKHFTGERDYHGFVRWPDDLGNYDGINLYKVLANGGVKYLASKYGLRVDRKAIIQWLHKALEKFKGGAWGYMEIKSDGTLKLTEEYFYTREQLMYMKGLPPSTIKGVWLRMEDFDLPESAYKETKLEAAKDLPGEAADRFEALQDKVRNLVYEDPREIDDYDLNDLIRFFKDYDEDEFAGYLESLADTPQDERDPDEWRDELEGVEMGLQDTWMEERESEAYGWGKLDLRKAAGLRPKKK